MDINISYPKIIPISMNKASLILIMAAQVLAYDMKEIKNM